MDIELNYAIKPISDINSINWDELYNCDTDSVRKSLDGNLFIIVWDSSTNPNCLNDNDIILNIGQLLTEMSSDNWHKKTLVP